MCFPPFPVRPSASEHLVHGLRRDEFSFYSSRTRHLHAAYPDMWIRAFAVASNPMARFRAAISTLARLSLAPSTRFNGRSGRYTARRDFRQVINRVAAGIHTLRVDGGVRGEVGAAAGVRLAERASHGGGLRLGAWGARGVGGAQRAGGAVSSSPDPDPDPSGDVCDAACLPTASIRSPLPRTDSSSSRPSPSPLSVTHPLTCPLICTLTLAPAHPCASAHEPAVPSPLPRARFVMARTGLG